MKAIPSPAIDHLKTIPNWVCWKQTTTKVPVNPHTGGNAMPNLASTWGTYEQAVKRFRMDKHKLKGLGFMFTKKIGIIAIDLDDEPNPVFFDGQLTKWSSDIVNAIDSYTELSPSGNGLHILSFGEIPRSLGAKKIHGFEMYNNGRWFTITGKHLLNTPLTIEKRHEPITKLHKQYSPQHTKPKTVRNYQSNNQVPSTQQISEMLACIPLPLGFSEWNSICMAVHSAYPNSDGFNLVMNWSSGHFKQGENEHQAMTAKWKSYNANGGININTLFHYAKLYGWQPQSTIRVNNPEPSNNIPPPPEPPSDFDLEPDIQPVQLPEPEIDTNTPDYKQGHKKGYSEGFAEGLDIGYCNGWHDAMTQAQRQMWQLGIGIPEVIVNELNLGFRQEIINQDTGEVEANDCLVLPHRYGDDIANIEYRSLIDGKVKYEINKPILYDVQPLQPQNHVCLLDDSIDSIKAYLNYGHVVLGGEKLHFMALPKDKLSLASLDILDANYVYVLMSKDADIRGRGLELLKSEARFARLPLSFDAVTNIMDDIGFVNLLRSAEKWS